MSLENKDIPEIEEINTDDDIIIEMPSELNDENNFEIDSKEDETGGQKKTNSASKIILYVIFSIIIIFCLVVIARNLFFNKGNNESASSSATNAAINAPKKIVDLYILDNLADDYKLTDQNLSDTKAVSTYNNKKNEVVFTQSTIDDYEPEYDVNDKDIVISDFHDGEDQAYRAYQINGKCYIVWTTDEYTFEIKTSLKKSESIPLIFNVQKADESSSSSESG